MPGPFEGSSTEQTAKILADVYDSVNHLLKTTGVGGAGGAVSVADGADVAEGATTDAAVTTDVAGTISGKLRGLVKIFGNVWDQANSALKVNVVAQTGGGLTDAQLRATPVPVSGTVTANIGTIAGIATEATLSTRAADATLTGGTTKAIARGAAKGATAAADATATSIDADHTGLDVKVQGSVPVTGPLTDAQLRAAAVPISLADGADVSQGTTADADTANTVIGRLKKIVAQTVGLALDVTAVAIRDRLPAALVGGRLSVDVGASVLPTGASTEATLALIKAKTDNIDVALSTRAVTGLTDAQLRATAVPVTIPTPVPVVSGGLGVMNDAHVEVIASGVPQQLPAQACQGARVTASRRNKGTIVIGGASVVEAYRDRTGVELRPGDSAAFPVSNTNVLFVCGSRAFDALAIASLV